MFAYFRNKVKAVVREIFEDLKPIIKEIAIEAAKTYLEGEIKRQQQK